MEDVELAAKHGAAGVILVRLVVAVCYVPPADIDKSQSNHGGRSLNFSPAPIDVLYEMRITKPGLFNKLEVYVDSGVRRGTDVVSEGWSRSQQCTADHASLCCCR